MIEVCVIIYFPYNPVLMLVLFTFLMCLYMEQSEGGSHSRQDFPSPVSDFLVLQIRL